MLVTNLALYLVLHTGNCYTNNFRSIMTLYIHAYVNMNTNLHTSTQRRFHYYLVADRVQLNPQPPQDCHHYRKYKLWSRYLLSKTYKTNDNLHGM